MRSSVTDAKFEEAVIDYLFTVYLIPIIMSPITLYEAKYHARIMNDFSKYEQFYGKVVRKKLNIFVGNKLLLITIALPIVSCASMIVNHITMVNFHIVQVGFSIVLLKINFHYIFLRMVGTPGHRWR